MAAAKINFFPNMQLIDVSSLQPRTPGSGHNAHAEELAFRPESWIAGSFGMGSETCFHPGYREWLRLLCKGVARDQS